LLIGRHDAGHILRVDVGAAGCRAVARARQKAASARTAGARTGFFRTPPVAAAHQRDGVDIVDHWVE